MVFPNYLPLTSFKVRHIQFVVRDPAQNQPEKILTSLALGHFGLALTYYSATKRPLHSITIEVLLTPFTINALAIKMNTYFLQISTSDQISN